METELPPTLSYPFNFYPLRVLKQIVCMFFSVNGPQFQKNQPELVRFVLNREMNGFPHHVRIYAFYTLSELKRALGAAGILRGLGTDISSFHMLSEITFPPFGFVMGLGDSPPPDTELCEISGFSKFQYGDWRAGISMKLPLMQINTAFPADYRDRAKVFADFEENKRLEGLAQYQSRQKRPAD